MSSRKKILVIDDETINLEFFEVMLSKLGFTVEKAEDGIAGLEKIKNTSPDLILLDNIMPKMSGWELTKTIKSDPKYREIPIIMLSALDDVKDKVEGFEMGVDDYITKPFNFSEVLARIRSVLRHRELLRQITARETRLALVEELSSGLKGDLAEIARSMDELDAAIQGGALDKLHEKSQTVRKHIAGLDARIEKTMTEWNNLKKNEIGIDALENQLRKSLQD